MKQPVVGLLPPLDPLEVHSGAIMGKRRLPPRPPVPPLQSLNVRSALEELLLPALSRPPCLIAFSGGRDSSVILAASTEAARRHGLDDPIPLTLRYQAHPRTWENEWQERTVRHLGLTGWEIIQIESELDALGSLARDVLVTHGLYWPGNAQTMKVLMDAAGTGSLITGNGGDEAFTGMIGNAAKRASIIQIVRMNPIRNVVQYLPLEFLPRPWKKRILARRLLNMSWLRPNALRAIRRRYLTRALEKRGASRMLETLHENRSFELARSAYDAIASDTGTLLCEPFWDHRFHLAAMASLPHEGFSSRNAAIAGFFGDLLPPDVSSRSTKAVFTEVFWGPASRAFAEQWDGDGLDPDLVDPARLRREWTKPRPDFRSITPLQAAWLATGQRAL